MSQTKSHYLYIGNFFHRKGKEFTLLEKKIGITGDLTKREYELGSTKSPIGYTIISAWDAGENAKKFEKQILALLKHNQSVGEWIEDDDEDLVARVSEFMKHENCTEINLKEDEDKDANNARKAERHNAEIVPLRENKDWLKDIPFHANRYKEKITVIMKAEGEYFCEQTGETYDSMNKAFTNAGKEITGRQDFPINVWNGVRDDDGNSPDDVLAMKEEERQKLNDNGIT